MQKAVPVALLLFLGACASMNDTVSLIPPDLYVEQIGRTTHSGRDAALRPVMGGAPVNLSFAIRNNSAEVITLKRIELMSVTEGAYSVPESARPFHLAIAPDLISEVRFWVPAYVQNTIVGGQGPVTLRVIAYFDSPAGPFRKIYMRVVNDPVRRRWD